MIEDDPIDALRRVALFAGLDPETLASVAHAMTRRRVAVGSVLIAQGVPGEALYVVVRGRLAAEVRNEEGEVRQLGEIVPGELVGEMAMLSSEPRSATVRALRTSEVVELTREAFERLCSRHPELMRRLASLLANRLRAANMPEPSREKLRTVALIPHDRSVRTASLAQQLHAALSCYGNWAVLDDEEFQRQAQTDRERRAHASIAALEHGGQNVLLAGSARDPAWNEIILTQADLILIVANADADPRPSDIEASIPPLLPAPRELVLLHEPGKDPSGTARWLGERTLARHHHLRRDDSAHTHRLARRLAGCSVGLVLGGGGARGFGHIGVMRAIAELGIPIDRVGGTSMGSIMAGEVALGWDWHTMHERTRFAFRRDPLAWDNTLPLVSKIACNKVVELFQGLFGDTRAEDCWLPYFSVSCSLTHARVVTHRAGPLWQCVRASSALPGLGPPVIQSGAFLVDGAILNNLPANLLEDEGMGPVIAVSVSPKEDLGTVWGDNYRLSGWRILWERLLGRPGAREYPSALWVLQRTVLLASVDMAERMKKVASLYLHLPVGDYEMFKWNAIDRIVPVGYEFSKGLLAQWAAGQQRVMAEGRRTV
jgi:predicted acylesterase/phospholipase RssA/CRP-like cAMP-binding protein